MNKTPSVQETINDFFSLNFTKKREKKRLTTYSKNIVKQQQKAKNSKTIKA